MTAPEEEKAQPRLIQPGFVPPFFDGDAFNCPHCGAFAEQNWFSVTLIAKSQGMANRTLDILRTTLCRRCREYSIWHEEKLIFPDAPGVEPPNADLPDEMRADYDEAASILNRSPRGAAALLRLAIEKLARHLGAKQKKLDDAIAELVERGLPATVQQSLDVVRVVGNNAVHPGQIDLKDDRHAATALFKLVDVIADKMITEPRHIQEIYDSLPLGSREAIEKRAKRPEAAEESQRGTPGDA